MSSTRERNAPVLDNLRRWRVGLLITLAMLAAVAFGLAKPIVQPEAYHAFHDARPLLGIANFANIVSNLPFLVIGLMGLRWLASRPDNLEAELLAPYRVVFGSLALVAAGSGYYHLAPTTETLVWDRLPMAIGFMALYAAVLAERSTPASARWLLPPFAIFGVLAALYSHPLWANDLRPYAFAQFFPMLTIPLVLWLYPARYTRGGDIMLGLGFYVAAKLLEHLDGPIYALGQLVSGHTLKHLAAAAGAWWMLRMLRSRQRL